MSEQPAAARPIRRRVVTEEIHEGPVRAQVFVCEAASCMSSQAHEVTLRLGEAVAEAGLTDVVVKRVGCLGLCAAGPLVEIPQTGQLFASVKPDGVEPIIEALRTAKDGDERQPQGPFFEKQLRVATENMGRIDPESLEDYLDRDGYDALRKVLSEMTSTEVREVVTQSGLRGRGGAGYPTGLKWTTVAKAAGTQKYVICNADEGDPGAFMDRSVLESDPFRVLEGMAIAAFAVHATEGYIYCRAEYPLAVARLRNAIRLAQRAGYLGTNIADTSFNFDIQIRLGAGAFVCGEETALIQSVEGKRGTPRPRPPYPAVSGLNNCPTLINNVETFASVATILRKGAEWYSGIGIGKSKGTKVFALAGRVVNTGLVEVPMGMTLREIIYDIGGGIIDGRPFKAVQTGGPSGGCIPAEHLDTHVSYESLIELGSFMGSGGMIIMDDTSCMVDVARYFMDFCRDESCGKCVPCRVGTTQLWMLLDKICNGHADMVDLAQLERLAGVVRRMSLCGLGQGAPNPIFSTLRYFRDEYLAHIVDKRCPAGVCEIEQPSEVLA
ncbi:MAG TPA: NuoF family protein [Candidatus Limnocylindrales bacterium]|nr:NuoF family protein [Candidatus Limnocylindrales bacterium]